MFKKVFAALLVLIIISGVWFFFIKEPDFRVSFQSEVAPGIVYQPIESGKFTELELLETINKTPFERIEQRIKIENVPFSLNWELSSEGDQVTLVQVKAENLQPTFQDRINGLLGTDKFQEKIEREVFQLEQNLQENRKFYKVNIEGELMSPVSTCACISLENTMEKKAFEMMATINHLSDFVMQNQLETNGRPRVHITNWNLKSNLINFDFCFPFKPTGEFPTHPFIFFKKIPSMPSIKATYHGNYMISHYAWMELLNYARTKEIEVSTMPLEIFHTNPELGGNPLNWKAEIFIPVK